MNTNSEEFKTKYNSKANEIAPQLGININGATIKTGAAQDVFQYSISQSVIIQGAIDKTNGKVKEAWILSKPQSSDDMLLMFMSYGLIMATLNPELSADERGTIFAALNLTDLESMKKLANGDASIVKGNVRYTAKLLPDVTFMLIGAAKDL